MTKLPLSLLTIPHCEAAELAVRGDSAIIDHNDAVGKNTVVVVALGVNVKL